ncbi:MAG TPA: hypothetical protein DEP84_15065 [Chloroflexi bacterium]|nr:hypothetical protein [Chloroflexota bacterium]
MFIFGWIGGVTGVTIGTEQLNMVVHNTLRLPGHFHATVVGGTTLAFMGLTYYVIPLIFRRELKLKRWAIWQPYVYGLGMTLVSVGMIASGIQGVSRRHWDVTFAQAAFPATLPGTVHLTLGIFGIGALIAIVGGVMFVTVVLASILNGKQVEARAVTLVAAPANLAGAAVAHKDEAHPEPKGTFVIVLIFLMYFATYYFANWWLLGGRWMVR